MESDRTGILLCKKANKLKINVSSGLDPELGRDYLSLA